MIAVNHVYSKYYHGKIIFGQFADRELPHPSVPYLVFTDNKVVGGVF